MDIPERWLNPCANSQFLFSGHLGGTSATGDPTTWYPEMWDWLKEEFALESALDVGCGIGYSTKYFHDIGLFARGIEGWDELIRRSPKPELIAQHDYTTGLFLPNDHWSFDLVYSSEFVEHVEDRYVGNILHSLSLAQKVICVGAALPGTGGYHHVNLRESSYWIEKIEAIGFTFSQTHTDAARALAAPGRCGRFINERPVSNFSDNGLIFIRGK
jgi:SAM-dependent methyltransferase